jgi:hypothetical protein
MLVASFGIVGAAFPCGSFCDMFVSIICDINDKRAEFSLARAFALDFVARSFVAYILPCGFV